MINVVVNFLNNLKEYGLEYYKRYYSVYKGFVYDNEDPEGLGRLQLIIPQFYDDEPYEYWAHPKGIYSGANTGFFFIPNKGDSVWVEFENGDSEYPVWSYGWWAKKEVPKTGKIGVNVLQTLSGHKIEMDDTNNRLQVYQGSKKYYIELNENGISLVGAKLALGTLDGAKEKGVLGDTLKSKMDALIDQLTALCDGLGQLTVPTGVGPSGTPINATTFIDVKTELTSIKNDLSKILSEKVTTD